MRLISGKEMLTKARENGYAVGAFTAQNAETVQAILGAAVEEKAPVIIQFGPGIINNMGMETMIRMIEVIGKDIDATVTTHLDHGNSYQLAMKGIQFGLQSVMYDGSQNALAENIEVTAKVVEAAHALDISVEGEVGRIGGTEDDISVDEEDAFLADPNDAKRFVEETKVDYLAAAIGTVHGVYKGEPKLNFQRLKEIADCVSLPLVLHGGSGIPDHMIRKAIGLGIAKINVDTELRQAYIQAIQKVLQEDPYEVRFPIILGAAREAVKEKVKEKIRLFGSSNQA